MKKIINIISNEYSDYPIVKYLKIIQSSWTKVFAIKMIRTGNVLVNGKRTKINYRLQSKDRLELYGYEEKSTPPEKLNLSKLKPLNIVYEDDFIIIVDKEIGIVVQSDESNAFNNMNNRLLKHINWNPENRQEKWKPTFIHRLDRNTSGLLIGAKTYGAYLEIVKAMKEGKIGKYYITKVHGLIPFKTKSINNYLLKLPEKNKVIQTKKTTPRAKQAISEIKLINHLMKTKESLLEVKIITGRTHQIRVHLAGIGFPIRGDQKYGVEKDRTNYPHPYLMAYKLTFDKDLEGEYIQNLRGKTFSLDNH